MRESRRSLKLIKNYFGSQRKNSPNVTGISNLILIIFNKLLFCSSLQHSAGDSATLTVTESCPSDESKCRVQWLQELHANTCSSTDVLPQIGPVTFEEHTIMVQKDFIELQGCKNSLLKYQVMVDVEKVLPLFKGPCGKKRQGRNEVVEQKLKAGILTITYQCKMAILTSGSKVLATKETVCFTKCFGSSNINYRK